MIAFTVKWYGARQWMWHHARGTTLLIIPLSSDTCWVTSQMAVWFGMQPSTSSFFLSLLEQISAAKTTYLGEMIRNRKQGFALALLLGCTVFKQSMGDLNRVEARIINESSTNPQFSNAVDNSLALNKCLTVTKAAGPAPAALIISRTQPLPW